MAFYRSRLENRDIRHAMNNLNGEATVYGKKVDGIYSDPITNITTVYEYQGGPFHGCPKCYDPKSTNFEGTKMRNLFQQTNNKNDYLRLRRIKVIEIYSCEFTSLKKSDEECKTILKDYHAIPSLNPRDALRGGRVECFKLLAHGDDENRIHYSDCNR